MTALALAGGLAFAAPASHAAIVWDQSDVATNTMSPSISDLDVATDFTLAAPTTLRAFSVWLYDGTSVGGDGVANGIFAGFSGSLSWAVLSDAAGRPSDEIASGLASAISVTDTGLDSVNDPDDIFRVDGTIAPGLLLPAGTYWFSVRESPTADGTGIRWAGTTAQIGEQAYVIPFWSTDYADRALVLRDDVPSVPAPASALALLTALAAFGALRGTRALQD